MVIPKVFFVRLNTRRRVATLACALATATFSVEFSTTGQPADANNAISDLTCPVAAQTATDSSGLTNQEQQSSTTPEGAQATTCGSTGQPAGQPAAANNAIIDLACPQVGAETATFSPGLTNQEQQIGVNVDGTQTLCLSVSDKSLTSGSYNFKLPPRPISCLAAALPEYDITYKWNNGKYSIVHLVSSLSTKAEGSTYITSIGTVVAGEFQGDKAVRSNINIAPDPTECLTPEGITSYTGVGTLTLIRSSRSHAHPNEMPHP